MWLLYCGFFYTIIVVTLCAFVPPGFEEVTTRKADGSIGAMQQCGDDTSEGRKMCVAYNLCNARTGYIDQSGMYDGFGIIDIRYCFWFFFYVAVVEKRFDLYSWQVYNKFWMLTKVVSKWIIDSCLGKRLFDIV